ncbi:MAG: DegT/DnrJ/EryC1/StrS aminotransferase family protein [Firmicutes bacterium]|nr:DegT/DnrJ/EryC1/StrS aminotransferase family protein [Alicyclobacillaceae bacterium]MCL6496269.1 DegT/DnrJ/EryC1/StrS aminotransferase family protein [Bacillota bacterium]
MPEPFLPFNRPELDEREAEALAEVVRSRWITRGPVTERFEAALSRYLDGMPVVALNSCTAGLHLALKVLGVGPGDEVVTTPYTFAATVNVIEHVGARPVLVDVEADTANLDLNAVPHRISRRTRVLLPVHFAGHPVDMDALAEISQRHGVAVVEDAAHALAAEWDGRRIGTFGFLAAFSFYATKNLATGEGGALVVPDPALRARVRTLSLHGLSQNAWARYTERGQWAYAIEEPGYKYNMTDLQAAMGLVQLEKLEGMQARRRALAARYHQKLAGLPVVLPAVRPRVGHAWHLYPLRLRLEQLTCDRSAVIEALRAAGIGTSVHFIPIHLHPYYQRRYGWRPGDFPRAEAYFAAEISLPLYPGMADADVDRVADTLARILERYQR